jgi:hypothetical protein
MKHFFSLSIAAAAFATAAFGQADTRVTLTVDLANTVNYRSDVPDYALRGANAGPTTVGASRAFTDSINVGDIVAVNGQPARGIWDSRVYTMNFSPTPAPGAAIADAARGGTADCKWDFYDVNGRYIGTILDGGYGMHGVTGGTGAFYGIRGQMAGGTLPNGKPNRAASISEDPANRRTLGGGTSRIIFHLIPAERPEVQAAYHENFVPVTSANPARPGEVLILQASGLGPLFPGTFPSGTDPFPNPPAEVNSPVEVNFGGQPAPVMNKIGWPGQTNTYRVDVGVPAGITGSDAAIQLTVAWIPGGVFRVPIQNQR